MQRQVKRRIERTEKSKKKPEVYKPISYKWIFLAVGIMAAIVLVAAGLTVFQNHDATVARFDGERIRASEIIYEMFVAQSRLEHEFMALRPGEPPLRDSLFRDGLTLGEAVRQEAAIAVATTIILREMAADLNVLPSEAAVRADADGVNMEDIAFLGITTRQQLLDAIEADHLRSNVPFALLNNLDELKALEGFDFEQAMGQMLAAQHILISFDYSPLAEVIFDDDDEEAREALQEQMRQEIHEAAFRLAMSLLERINEGEDFEELMLLYSDDQDPNAPPDLYTFLSGFMVPEFEAGTRALEIGEISEPIRSMWGYHIIRRMEPVLEELLFHDRHPFEEPILEAIWNKAAERIVFLSAINRVEFPGADW